MADTQIRNIRLSGQVAYVPLTQGLEAIIDASDVELVTGHNWCAYRTNGNVYAVTNHWDSRGVRKLLRMHRLILGATGDVQVDHMDRSGTNNTKANLRLVNRFQNQQNRKTQANNTSGFKGVCRVSKSTRWKAAIKANGIKYHIGSFGTPEEAYAAYCDAARRMHGDFVCLD